MNLRRLEPDELRAMARTIRIDNLNMVYKAQSGHIGGVYSSAEILACLWFRVLRHDPENPAWPERDRFVLSKGHASAGLFSCLAHAGYFPVDELPTFRALNSRLQGHPDRKTPGVEVATGSLGNGIAQACGIAHGLRMQKLAGRVYCIVGDGECQEGLVWEAAMSAAHYKLDHLTVFVDYNDLQIDGFVHDIMEVKPLPDKWRAFGFHVQEIDGHDVGAILTAIAAAQSVRGQPQAIIARTVKGKGVSIFENSVAFHGKAPNADQYQLALRELGAA